MNLFDTRFTQTKEYEKLAHALSGPGACALFGLPGAGRALVYAALARQTGLIQNMIADMAMRIEAARMPARPAVRSAW